MSEMLPGILSQLGPNGLMQLKKIANDIVANKKFAPEEDDVPDLVENFEDVAIKGTTTAGTEDKSDDASSATAEASTSKSAE